MQYIPDEEVNQDTEHRKSGQRYQQTSKIFSFFVLPQKTPNIFT